MKPKEIYMYCLGAFIILCATGATIFMMAKVIPERNHDIVNNSLSQLWILAALVTGYFYGSSKSSADKNELLKDKTPQP